MRRSVLVVTMFLALLSAALAEDAAPLRQIDCAGPLPRGMWAEGKQQDCLCCAPNGDVKGVAVIKCFPEGTKPAAMTCEMVGKEVNFR